MNFLKKLINRFVPPDSVPTDERRQSVRLTFRVPIEVKTKSETISASLVNLTFTGLCIEVERPLAEDQELTLVRDDFGPSFNGTVIWCKRMDAGKYLVGIECELDEEKLINSWLEPTLVQAGFEADYVDEKRELVRVPGRVPCRMTSAEGEELGDGQMLDLSRGGALMECPFEMEEGCEVSFRTAPLGKLEPFEGRALVSSARKKENGRWMCGLKFKGVSSEEVEPYMKFMMRSEK